MKNLGARPLVMGILNVTPDSFSGDGVMDGADAVERARRLVEEGADIIDIGGESSRPGASPVTAAEEIRRVVPVIAAIREKFPALPISVDTVKADVAAEALKAGATIINDISALGDAGMAELAARARAYVVLMHNRAEAKSLTPDGNSYSAAPYANVVEDVANDLAERIAFARRAGIAAEKIIADPGIGFGKTPEQNVSLIRAAGELKKRLGVPVLIGHSRKSFIAKIPGATTASLAREALEAGADILRLHEVGEITHVVKKAFKFRRIFSSRRCRFLL